MNGFISMIIISALCLLVGILSIKSGIRKKKVCTELANGNCIFSNCSRNKII